MTFSCAGDLSGQLKNKKIERVVFAESKVTFVFANRFGFIANGFQVHIAADAVSSRRKFDYEIALERLRSNGAEITLRNPFYSKCSKFAERSV
jgi:hypothetical protein